MRSTPAGRRRTTNLLTLVCVLAAIAGCTPSTSERAPMQEERSFAQLAILPTLELASAPQVVLATARDFRDLCLEAEADRVLGRMDPQTGAWLDFALVYEGAFYVLPALGYHTPADRLNGERLEIPDSTSYYALQRRGIPEYRYRSYFVE